MVYSENKRKKNLLPLVIFSWKGKWNRFFCMAFVRKDSERHISTFSKEKTKVYICIYIAGFKNE